MLSFLPPGMETERLNRIIRDHAGMPENQFFAAELREWKASKARKAQIDGSKYYKGGHDILNRQRTMIGEDGKLQAVDNLPNNKLIDNQYALMVDQKVNYFVGKPLSVNCDNAEYAKLLNAFFSNRFNRTLKYICEDALKGGIAWLYPYYDENGELTFKHFPAYEVLPFWADDDHTKLDCAIRLYPQIVYTGSTKEVKERVEIYKPDGIYRYTFENDLLTPDVDSSTHSAYFEADGASMNWERIPLIPFKYNKGEIPLLDRVRSLQDALNQLTSDYMNNMEEDARNTILVIKNYDGQELGEFRHNLSTFGAVKVRDDGGVSTLAVEVNSENYKSIIELLKKAIINNARGYDAKDDRLSGNPNQMNIMSMYSDIDLDCNGMETEFAASMQELLWFINRDIEYKGGGSFDGEHVDFIFNRDVLINESESIANCTASTGLLSKETVISQHPWVRDVESELKRIKKEEAEAMTQAQEYAGAFNVQNQRQNQQDEQ